MFADVVVGLSVDKLDKTFSYKIPDEWTYKEDLVGMEVIVPFGTGNREIKGFVVDVKSETTLEKDRIKKIIGISENSIKMETKLIKLAYWIKENYGGTVNEAIRTVLQVPKKIERIKDRTVVLCVNHDIASEKLEEFTRKGHKAKARILEKAIEGNFNYENFIKETRTSRVSFTSLIDENLIKIKENFKYRNPIEFISMPQKKISLNKEQSEVAEKIKCDYKSKKMGKYLLFGITGSGKTEVYMDVMEEIIKSGKQVIFLIPEIALSFQMVERLATRFGDRISIMNSKMSQGERYDQYLRAIKGEIDIIVGPRSALFTPFSNLGLIIVDEEHDGSYKSFKTPRYHAREVALYLAKLENSALILGSATPSLEAVQLVQKKELEMFTLKNRPNGALRPSVEVIDLRKELKTGNKSIISNRLKELIKNRLEKKEQTILFINRRGYAGFVSCRSCGEVIKCRHCDVALTFHRPDRLICHYCGYEERTPKLCPKCNSKYIATFGIGTEQVEKVVKTEFPDARVLRMDGDTTVKKNSYEEILKKMKGGDVDILIGTQMIVKGHDFEKVTLVGILAADLSLFSGSYKSSEITFQLLVQASGRAGRGRYPGNVVIQTYRPSHYTIVAAAKNDYREFYAREFKYRKIAGYPPEKHLLGVIVFGIKSEDVTIAANTISQKIKEMAIEDIEAYKPVWAIIPRIKDVYRKIIYLKSVEREKLVKIKNIIELEARDNVAYSSVSVQFDFEPVGNP